MKKLLLYLLCGFLIASCKKPFDGPNYYADDFETVDSLTQLLSYEDTLWSFTQITKEGNAILIDSTFAHSGTNSLKFTAGKSSDEIVSKCSIAKQNMAFRKGETVRLSAWYYISDTLKLDWLFLMDLEEQVAIGAGPGMRLALVNNQLRVEYKFYENDIVQEPGMEVDLPRNQWVELIWEVTLSRKNKGSVRLWQNGVLIINSTGNRTMPKDLLYSQQGTKGIYSSVEMGVTANSRDNDLTIWVDDVRMEKVE